MNLDTGSTALGSKIAEGLYSLRPNSQEADHSKHLKCKVTTRAPWHIKCKLSARALRPFSSYIAS